MKNEISVMIKNMKKSIIDAPLYCFIDGGKENEPVVEKLSAAVFLFLFYEDSLKKYSSFINAIPRNVKVYIISTQFDMKKLATNYLHRDCSYIFKENRGRDVSALLVAARNELVKFDYICFIHDKKAKNTNDVIDAEYWCKNFWMNLIGQEESYINNILKHFEMNPRLGLMVPHPPLSTRFDIWRGENLWGVNKANCDKLCNELELNIQLDDEGSYVTYGTAFWARRDAIYKLISKDWRYEDFPDEPLPDDGTISHAIERMLGYIVFAAGYIMEIAFSSDYLNDFVDQIRRRARVSDQEKVKSFEDFLLQLKNDFGIGDKESLNNWENRAKGVLDYCFKNEHLYIWGDGFYALEAYLFLQKHSITPFAFIVNKFSYSTRSIQGIPILHFDEVECEKVSGILIAVKEEEKVGTIKFLKSKGVRSFYLYNI